MFHKSLNFLFNRDVYSTRESYSQGIKPSKDILGPVPSMVYSISVGRGLLQGTHNGPSYMQMFPGMMPYPLSGKIGPSIYPYTRMYSGTIQSAGLVSV
jgi:hypothetical protein